jgi:uncharacterized protein YecT (DUF1311 family)
MAAKTADAPIALAAIALLLLCRVSAAQSDDPFKGTDCNKAQTQMELNYCADKAFQAEDKTLNALYRKLMASYDAKDQALLRTAEKNWLAYRDSECEFETSGSEGGSIHPMEGSNCLTEKTKARIKELQAQAD